MHFDNFNNIRRKFKKIEHGVSHFGEKRNKYWNIPTQYNGKKFDSIAECVRFQTLQGREKQGYIEGLEVQVGFNLMCSGIKVAKYIADFVYLKDGEMVVEDVKNPLLMEGNSVFNLKKKMLKAQYGLDIKIIHPNEVRFKD